MLKYRNDLLKYFKKIANEVGVREKEGYSSRTVSFL